MKEFFVQVFSDPAARDIIFPAMLVLLTIPQNLLGQLLKYVPKSLLPRENIPYLLAAAGWIAAKGLCYKYPFIPSDIATLVGVGSGFGAKAVQDHSLTKKIARTRIA